MLRIAMIASGKKVNAQATSTQDAHDDACPSGASARRRLTARNTNAAATTQKEIVTRSIANDECHSSMWTARIRRIESERK